MTTPLEKKSLNWGIWGAIGGLVSVALAFYVFTSDNMRSTARENQNSVDRISALELDYSNYSKDHDAIVSISATLSAIKDVSVQQHSEEMKAISNLYQVILQHIEASKSTSSNSLTNSHNLVQVPDTGRSFRNPHASSVESAN